MSKALLLTGSRESIDLNFLKVVKYSKKGIVITFKLF